MFLEEHCAKEDIVPSSRISEFYSFYYSAAVFAMAIFCAQVHISDSDSLADMLT